MFYKYRKYKKKYLELRGGVVDESHIMKRNLESSPDENINIIENLKDAIIINLENNIDINNFNIQQKIILSLLIKYSDKTILYGGSAIKFHYDYNSIKIIDHSAFFDNDILVPPDYGNFMAISLANAMKKNGFNVDFKKVTDYGYSYLLYRLHDNTIDDNIVDINELDQYDYDIYYDNSVLINSIRVINKKLIYYSFFKILKNVINYKITLRLNKTIKRFINFCKVYNFIKENKEEYIMATNNIKEIKRNTLVNFLVQETQETQETNDIFFFISSLRNSISIIFKLINAQTNIVLGGELVYNFYLMRNISEIPPEIKKINEYNIFIDRLAGKILSTYIKLEDTIIDLYNSKHNSFVINTNDVFIGGDAVLKIYTNNMVSTAEMLDAILSDIYIKDVDVAPIYIKSINNIYMLLQLKGSTLKLPLLEIIEIDLNYLYNYVNGYKILTYIQLQFTQFHDYFFVKKFLNNIYDGNNDEIIVQLKQLNFIKFYNLIQAFDDNILDINSNSAKLNRIIGDGWINKFENPLTSLFNALSTKKLYDQSSLYSNIYEYMYAKNNNDWENVIDKIFLLKKDSPVIIRKNNKNTILQPTEEINTDALKKCLKNIENIKNEYELYLVNNAKFHESKNIFGHSLWVATIIYDLFTNDGEHIQLPNMQLWASDIDKNYKTVSILAGYLHDIGKIGTSDNFHKLSHEGVIVEHPYTGFQYLLGYKKFFFRKNDIHPDYFNIKNELLKCDLIKDIDYFIIAIASSLHYEFYNIIINGLNVRHNTEKISEIEYDDINNEFTLIVNYFYLFSCLVKYIDWDIQFDFTNNTHKDLLRNALKICLLISMTDVYGSRYVKISEKFSNISGMNDIPNENRHDPPPPDNFVNFGYNSEKMWLLRHKIINNFDYLYNLCFIDNNILISAERNNVPEELLPLPYNFITYCPEITYKYDAKNYYVSHVNNSITMEAKNPSISMDINQIVENPPELNMSMCLELKGFSSELFDFNDRIAVLHVNKMNILLLVKKLNKIDDYITININDILYTRNLAGDRPTSSSSLEFHYDEWLKFNDSHSHFYKYSTDDIKIELYNISFMMILRNITQKDIFNIYDQHTIDKNIFGTVVHQSNSPTKVDIWFNISSNKFPRDPAFFGLINKNDMNQPNIEGKYCIIYKLFKNIPDMIDLTQSIYVTNPISKTIFDKRQENMEHNDNLISLCLDDNFKKISSYKNNRPYCDVNSSNKYAGRRRLQLLSNKTRIYKSMYIWSQEHSTHKPDIYYGAYAEINKYNLYHPQTMYSYVLTDYDCFFLKKLNINGFFSTDYTGRITTGELFIAFPEKYLMPSTYSESQCSKINEYTKQIAINSGVIIPINIDTNIMAKLDHMFFDALISNDAFPHIYISSDDDVKKYYLPLNSWQTYQSREHILHNHMIDKKYNKKIDSLVKYIYSEKILLKILYLCSPDIVSNNNIEALHHYKGNSSKINTIRNMCIKDEYPNQRDSYFCIDEYLNDPYLNTRKNIYNIFAKSVFKSDTIQRVYRGIDRDQEVSLLNQDNTYSSTEFKHISVGDVIMDIGISSTSSDIQQPIEFATTQNDNFPKTILTFMLPENYPIVSLLFYPTVILNQLDYRIFKYEKINESYIKKIVSRYKTNHDIINDILLTIKNIESSAYLLNRYINATLPIKSVTLDSYNKTIVNFKQYFLVEDYTIKPISDTMQKIMATYVEHKLDNKNYKIFDSFPIAQNNITYYLAITPAGMPESIDGIIFTITDVVKHNSNEFEITYDHIPNAINSYKLIDKKYFSNLYKCRIFKIHKESGFDLNRIFRENFKTYNSENEIIIRGPYFINISNIKFINYEGHNIQLVMGNLYYPYLGPYKPLISRLLPHDNKSTLDAIIISSTALIKYPDIIIKCHDRNISILVIHPDATKYFNADIKEKIRNKIGYGNISDYEFTDTNIITITASRRQLDNFVYRELNLNPKRIIYMHVENEDTINIDNRWNKYDVKTELFEIEKTIKEDTPSINTFWNNLHYRNGFHNGSNILARHLLEGLNTENNLSLLGYHEKIIKDDIKSASKNEIIHNNPTHTSYQKINIPNKDKYAKNSIKYLDKTNINIHYEKIIDPPSNLQLNSIKKNDIELNKINTDIGQLFNPFKWINTMK